MSEANPSVGAELLAAAKRADEWFKWFYEGKKDVFHPTWSRLKRAIAKAERADTNSHAVRKARGAMVRDVDLEAHERDLERRSGCGEV